MVADFKMNPEKLKQMQANVRIGGKGTARRKKKVVHRTATTDDKKLQSSLKKLSGIDNKTLKLVNYTAKSKQIDFKLIKFYSTDFWHSSCWVQQIVPPSQKHHFGYPCSDDRSVEEE